VSISARAFVVSRFLAKISTRVWYFCTLYAWDTYNYFIRCLCIFKISVIISICWALCNNYRWLLIAKLLDYIILVTAGNTLGIVVWIQAGFYRVDHDYVVNSARLAKDGGCSQFHIISSIGANKDSSFLYTRTKVEISQSINQFYLFQTTCIHMSSQ